MITNKVTKAVFELLGDKVPGGYQLSVNNENIPLFLNKDKVTQYPQIRVSPFIQKGDTKYQKYTNHNRESYRHWQYGVFQVDIYSKDLAEAQNIYDEISKRLFDFFNLEVVTFNDNKLFEKIDDNTYRSREYSLMDDGLFKDIYGIKIKNTILKRVQFKEDLCMNSFYVSKDFLYIETNQDLKYIQIKVLMQGRLFSNGFSFSDNGLHDYYLSKQKNMSSLASNNVERISFDLDILFSNKMNREELPRVRKIGYNKPKVR